jgi:hypothetical protein
MRQGLYFTNYAIIARLQPGVLVMDVGTPGMPLP